MPRFETSACYLCRRKFDIGMKELRFVQPNQIGEEILKDPVKLKAYFDWKYENFEEEYKLYCEGKRKLRDEFLDALPPEKREYYLNRYKEYYDRFGELLDRYHPIMMKSIENKDLSIFEKTVEEENAEYKKLVEEYKDIDFMLK